ncbi:lipoprotein, putative [Burkholderia pseudomallei 1258a]|nr:glycine-rich protein [Burkholderia pseudomallei 1106a]AFI68438.1 lipoprotein, putative [Burkholderia pseudomallei 1026b]AFR18122.1 glycine-rich protein [Burkholderia pseudomallei BPC006]EDO86752.1 putative lipoprotein [Burkholderia pseudomallei 406e]EDO92938.1 putative lipoprotein [Burkholderia pseudomallei Pasteur 52237]EDS84736.1 putative lipoprotein [Burkholderia pseudomallei S13]EDU10436.1 putative lipoprotein [Burkholderia pseudomallei 1655]EEC33949.1 conserved domain protein [Burkho
MSIRLARLIALSMLATLVAGVSGCVVEPVQPAAHWHPAHYDVYGYWHPGHWGP